MAKIKVTGDIITLVSAITAEDFSKVKRYMPEAGVMLDEKGNQVFKVDYRALSQEQPNAYGVVYGAVDFGGKMIAQFPNPVQGNHNDAEAEKKVIVNRYAGILSKLNEVEAHILSCLPQILGLEAEVSESIVIEGGE